MMQPADKRRFFHATLYPSLFTFILLMIKLIEELFNTSFYEWGMLPRTVSGLFKGVLCMPLIHSDWPHLFSNIVALWTLGFLLIFFYRPIHFKIFWFIFFGSGVFTWLFGRSGYHVGASGIVYGLVSFLFLSGILRKHIHLMSVSALTVLFYGSIVWGIFPIALQLSWEGHLGGFMTGVLLALFYRNKGPQPPVFKWTNDPHLEHNEWQLTDNDAISLQNDKTKSDEIDSAKQLKINYEYKSLKEK
jgi:membrane associated rhomboid family serine protease